MYYANILIKGETSWDREKVIKGNSQYSPHNISVNLKLLKKFYELKKKSGVCVGQIKSHSIKIKFCFVKLKIKILTYKQEWSSSKKYLT